MASLCLSVQLCQSLRPSFPKSMFIPPRFTSKKLRRAGGARMSLNPIPATDRLLSTAAYALPFFNSLHYGRYLFMKYPQVSRLLEPLLPLLSAYRSIPYASFVAFFALYLGVVRNQALSLYVRFNAMQAVTLDVLLVVPLLLTRILSPGRAGAGQRVMIWGHGVVFVFSCTCFVYSVVSCALGRTPYLPFVADAAARQV